MSAPAEDARLIAARAKIRLITCEQGLGLVRPESCAARWLVACGRAPGPASIRDSRCKGCEHGQHRHAELSGRKKRAIAQRLGEPRRKPAKAPPKPKVRKCAGPGCEVTFEVHGGQDGNKRYHDDACKQAAVELQQANKPQRSRRLGATPKAKSRRDALWCRRCGERLALDQVCTRCAPSEAAERIERRVG